MKVRNKRIHMYPIYSIHEDAYIVNDFNVSCNMSSSNEIIKFICRPTLTNQSIIDLLISGKVKLYLHLECSLTKYRNAWELSDLSETIIPVKSDLLNKQISVSFWLVTIDKLTDYEFIGLTDFYADSRYTIPPYTYIGYSDSYIFILNKSINDDATPTSIFRISKTNKNAAYYIPEDTGIIIYLPDEAYTIYHDLRGNGIKEKIGIVILPVLVDVLHSIKIDPLSYDQYIWFRILEAKLNEFGLTDGFSDSEFDSDKVYEFAQFIFRDIIYLALKDLSSIYWGDE